ncbi:MAG: tetratricopeptide repeat protein [bacterium]|nr:MAG: tetratricopeptide repeat protein [bacterium]
MRPTRLPALLMSFLLAGWLCQGCAVSPEKPTPPSGASAGSPGRGAPPAPVAAEGSKGSPLEDSYALLGSLWNSYDAGREIDTADVFRITELLPQSTYSWTISGLAALRRGETTGAVEDLKRAASLDPANEISLTVLGQIALESGDLTAADRYFFQAYEAAKTPAAANRLALLRMRGGYLESARDILSETLAAHPADVMTRNNLSVALEMMGSSSEAIRLLSGGKLASRELLHTRALLLLKEGRPQEASMDLEAATEEGHDFTTWLLLGATDLQRGNVASAEGKFLRAVEASPDRHEGYLNLGLALRRQGKFSEARRVYEKGIERAPHPDLHLNLGVLLELYRGEPDSALVQYQAYVEEEGPGSQRVKGWIEYLKGVVYNR